MKIALFVLCDTDRLENLGRMSNAFMMAKEALENDDDLKFIFSRIIHCIKSIWR